MPTNLGYDLIDADNHYYEAEDAFTRHGDESVKRYVRWIQEGKRRNLRFGENIADTPANPTFNPIAKAGAFHQRLKDLEAGKGRDDAGWEFARSQYGELEPLRDEYRDRDARIAAMDEQGVEQCFLFPTLGDCVEGLMTDEPVMGHKAFHAYNLWLEDDWGYGYQNRLWSPAYIPMLDPDLAAEELEFVVNRGAKVVSIRPTPAAGRSQADPAFDRFWSIANEAKTFVAYHAYGGRTVYDPEFKELYGRVPYSDKGYYMTLAHALNANRGIYETTISLVLGNLFGRFPDVRVGSIEMGMQWVAQAIHAVDHAGGLVDRKISAFGQTLSDLPSDVFKEHIYVSPFPEEDVVALTEMIGVDRVLFGSDWPHPEGNITPLDYVSCIEKLDEADIKRIMRDNALELINR